MLMLIKTAKHRDSLGKSAQNILYIKGTYTVTNSMHECIHMYVAIKWLNELLRQTVDIKTVVHNELFVNNDIIQTQGFCINETFHTYTCAWSGALKCTSYVALV